jgi:type IV pilus assembly protein PilQ
VALSLLRPNILLDLELSALQTEGRGEIVSSPRILTANGKEAVISSGSEVPFLSAGDGGTNVQFKDATLETRVTPQITPGGDVILDIKVSRNDVDFARSVEGNPLILKRELETRAIVSDGQTLVLGGIYELDQLSGRDSVPFLGDVPFVRNFFSNRSLRNSKAELLIFVTPRVLN